MVYDNLSYPPRFIMWISVVIMLISGEGVWITLYDNMSAPYPFGMGYRAPSPCHSVVSGLAPCHNVSFTPLIVCVTLKKILPFF